MPAVQASVRINNICKWVLVVNIGASELRYGSFDTVDDIWHDDKCSLTGIHKAVETQKTLFFELIPFDTEQHCFDRTTT